MKLIHTLAAFAVAGVLAGSVTATPAGAQMHKMNTMQMKKMASGLKGWPAASREAAMYMANKYGWPATMTADMITWGRTGPWKRTAIYRMEYPHNFPGPHTDVMQQWIDYKAPPGMYSELAMYDGSVVLERTAGEISARCDKEAANFLALNLANEIVTGKRSVADARKMYGEQVMALKAGRPAPYTTGFLFSPPMGGTGDSDHPEM